MSPWVSLCLLVSPCVSLCLPEYPCASLSVLLCPWVSFCLPVSSSVSQCLPVSLGVSRNHLVFFGVSPRRVYRGLELNFCASEFGQRFSKVHVMRSPKQVKSKFLNYIFWFYFILKIPCGNGKIREMNLALILSIAYFYTIGASYQKKLENRPMLFLNFREGHWSTFFP